MRPLFAFVIALFACLTIVLPVYPQPVRGSTNSLLGTLTWTPMMAADEDLTSGVICVTYHNNLNHSVTGFVYGVIHDSQNQTTQVIRGTLPLKAGETSNTYLQLSGSLHGQLTIAVFATTNDTVAISVTQTFPYLT